MSSSLPPIGAYGRPADPPASFVLHLEVSDADTAWKRALDVGASVRFELSDQFWGDRYGQVTDPFGFIWGIGAPIKKLRAAQPTSAATV